MTFMQLANKSYAIYAGDDSVDLKDQNTPDTENHYSLKTSITKYKPFKVHEIAMMYPYLPFYCAPARSPSATPER